MDINVKTKYKSGDEVYFIERLDDGTVDINHAEIEDILVTVKYDQETGKSEEIISYSVSTRSLNTHEIEWQKILECNLFETDKEAKCVLEQLKDLLAMTVYITYR